MELGWGLMRFGWEALCRSGNIDPILEATLPRLPSPTDFSFNVPTPPPGFRSGLVFGLEPRFGVKACFNLPTGDGERFSDPFVGARSVLSRAGVDAEAARTSTLGKVAARGVGPSSWASDNTDSGSVTDWTSGEDVVKYPVCEGCVDRGGGFSTGLQSWLS